MTKIIDIVLKKRSCWINMTIPTQTIAFTNGAVSYYGRNINDVITSIRRGFEMGDYL